MTPNESGKCPREARGKRIHARLFNGTLTRAKSPNGWPADGRDGCDWRISKPPFPFEIEAWELT